MIFSPRNHHTLNDYLLISTEFISILFKSTVFIYNLCVFKAIYSQIYLIQVYTCSIIRLFNSTEFISTVLKSTEKIKISLNRYLKQNNYANIEIIFNI